MSEASTDGLTWPATFDFDGDGNNGVHSIGKVESVDITSLEDKEGMD